MGNKPFEPRFHFTIELISAFMVRTPTRLRHFGLQKIDPLQFFWRAAQIHQRVSSL